MTEFQKWLICKLGGCIPQEHRGVIFKSDYYKDEHVGVTITVPYEHYTVKNNDNIEQELVRLLGNELLDRDLLYFYDSGRPDRYGDIQVGCQFHVLKNRDRTGLMPPRLKYRTKNGWPNDNSDEGDEPMNERKETK